ncbi:hypothetical protein [Wolbachia endosymbiont of Armadillidium arcangelii]|uniref:Uncharacterized protein n=1 Tax=Wolbachia endosymbiont of Armadillidium arcangelii TaxID=3158571 RepID=A0AAU7Q3X8_9RICK
MNFNKHVQGGKLRLDYQRVDIKELISFLQENRGITQLSLRDCSIDEEGVKALAKLTNLTKLDLCDNKIGDEGVKALAKLTNLTVLDLSLNKIGEEGVKALAKLTNLTELNLWSNNIGEEGAKALAKLTNLIKLNLWNNNIGAEGVKALAKLTKLTELNLGSNNIGAEGVKALVNLTKFIKFDLNSNNIGIKEVKALAESEEYWEFIDEFGYTCLGSSLVFYQYLKASWSKARARSNGNVGKLDENSVKKLFFDLARQNYRREGIELLLNDPDKYPFLINSRDEQGHTLSHFYTYSPEPEMQKFFFERGMVPEEERNQRREDKRIARDSQSVHRSPIVKRINFFTKKLVESVKVDKEQLKQAAASYVENIPELLEQYHNDPIRLRLLNLTDNEKRSVMERTLSDNDPIPNDKKFIKDVIDEAKRALEQQYLKKNDHGEYDQEYSTQKLQYDYTGDDAKITIPESIGYIKLLIDNFSVPLKGKKELLVTLMEQNSELVRGKLSIIRKELGNSDILNEGQFKKTELHGLLNGIDDDKKINKLFKEISGLDIEKVWREQKEFVLLKQIYIAATTYGENSSACIQGTWTQIISSIEEISSEIVERYDCYLEKEQKLEVQKDVITKENITPFIENLADRLIQYVKDNPELQEVLQHHLLRIECIDINDPEKVTFKQQKILAEISKYFSENIKGVLPNYNRSIPSRGEYALVIEGLSEIEVMQRFAQEPSNLQENITRETEAQIDENSDFDAEDNSNSYATISESDTDEEFYDANESIFPEESKTLLVPERLQPENSVIATDQTNGIQNNNRQPSPRIEKKTIVAAASTLAIAGVALGVAIAVYLEMLAVGIAVGACCLVAAAIIYCCNSPSNSLKNSDATIVTNERHLEA